MVRRLLPVLIATTCYFTASGFNPSNGVVNRRLDFELIETPVLASEESAATEPKSEENLREMPPVIQQIADERREFQMNLGKAMDTLRKDMPEILKRKPDYSIYHDKISVIDPSGVQLTGLDAYKSSINFLQTFIKFWFQRTSGIQYRMVYDFCRSSIRVSWHAVLIPKVPLGRPLHIDCISMYKVDASSGKIIEHKFEKLVINDTPVAPPYGIFSLMQRDLLGLKPQGAPVGGGGIPAGA